MERCVGVSNRAVSYKWSNTRTRTRTTTHFSSLNDQPDGCMMLVHSLQQSKNDLICIKIWASLINKVFSQLQFVSWCRMFSFPMRMFVMAIWNVVLCFPFWMFFKCRKSGLVSHILLCWAKKLECGNENQTTTWLSPIRCLPHYLLGDLSPLKV